MILRPYQAKALNNILWAKQNNLAGNDLISLPTGSGKSLIIAHLVKELNEPILILQPTKEILEQNVEKLAQYIDRSDIGVYSASMNEKTVKYYTFATIQSIYKKPEEFKHFNLVVIDECHLVNPKKDSGMFNTFLKAIGNPQVIGFTATPYRMDSQYYDWHQENERCETTIKLINRMWDKKIGFFWARILHNTNIQDLIDKDFLCSLEYVDESIVDQADLPLNVSRSDFDMQKFDKEICKQDGKVIKIIEKYEKTSRSVLVFCSSVEQATRLAASVKGAAVVSAKTSKKDRAKIINDFKNHATKTVFNVGVLTTGFDHPTLDCIVLLRPTSSIALYYQMIGRGVRIAPNKTHCKVIDLTSTVKTMGKVETIRLEKVKGKSGYNKWELLSETGSWHGRELFAYYPNLKYYKRYDKNYWKKKHGLAQ